MRRITVVFDVPATSGMDGPIECPAVPGHRWYGWHKHYPEGEVVGYIVSNEPWESDKDRADRLDIEVHRLTRELVASQRETTLYRSGY